jgi:hypothetical protein
MGTIIFTVIFVLAVIVGFAFLVKLIFEDDGDLK